MFITGPDVVKTVTGEDVTQRGARRRHDARHASRACATFVGDDEEIVLDEVRYLLRSCPSNNLEEPPHVASERRPEPRVPGAARPHPGAARTSPYDMKKVIAAVVDDGDFFEYFPLWAGSNIVCGFARLDGHPVGIVGNQPMVLAGVLDIDAPRRPPASCARATRSTSRSSPSSTCPASSPASTRSTAASSATAPSCSTPTARPPCPRIQIITRKAYGGAYVVMNSKSIGADLAFAWPSAELAVMGPQGAVEIVYRKEIDSADDPIAKRGRAGRRVHRALRQPVRRGRARLRRRRHRPGRHPHQAGRRPRAAAHQARGAAEAQARQRPALMRCDDPSSRRLPTRRRRRSSAAIEVDLAPRGRGVGRRGAAPLAVRRALVDQADRRSARATLVRRRG